MQKEIAKRSNRELTPIGIIVRRGNGIQNIAEFKMDVLTFMNDTGASFFEIAAVFNIPSKTTIMKWKKVVDQNGVDALIPKKKGVQP